MKAQKDKIKSALENIDWPTIFAGLDVDDMTQLFASKCLNILSQYIPHRVYKKYVKRGRKPDDFEYVCRNETSFRITKAKDDYFFNLCKKSNEWDQVLLDHFKKDHQQEKILNYSPVTLKRNICYQLSNES